MRFETKKYIIDVGSDFSGKNPKRRIDTIYRRIKRTIKKPEVQRRIRIGFAATMILAIIVSTVINLLNFNDTQASSYSGKHLRTVEYTLGSGGGTSATQTGTDNNGTARASGANVWFGNQWNATEATAGTKTIKLDGTNVRVVSAYLNFQATMVTSIDITNLEFTLDVNPGPAQTIDTYLDTFPTGAIFSDTSGTAGPQVSAYADATSLFQGQSDAQWSTGLAVHGFASIVGPTWHLATMKLVLTYEQDYSVSSHNETKTIRFPLDSTNGSDTGTRNADCPISTTCSFTYDTTNRLPDLAQTSDLYDAWFEINAIGDSTITAGSAQQFTPSINGGAAGTLHSTLDPGTEIADNLAPFVIYRPSIATNNFDPLVTASDTVDIANGATDALSGLTIELVMTYKYSTGASSQTETIRYYEFMHTANPALATRYNFTGANGSTNVTISNTGLNVRNLWFKVNASAVATGGLQIYGKVGAATETSNTFNLTSAQPRGGSSPVILDLTDQVEGGTDYFSSATTAVTGGYQWNTATGSVAAAEMWATFTWSGSSGGTMTKTNLFYAGSNAHEAATLANGGVQQTPFKVELPEAVTKTYRSTYLDVNKMHSQATSLTANTTTIALNQSSTTAIPMLTDTTSEAFDQGFFKEVGSTQFSGGSTISWTDRAFRTSIYHNDDDEMSATAQLVVTYDAALGAINLQQNHYRWRDDSTALNTDGGWIATQDNIPTLNKSTTYRARVEMANTGSAPANRYPYQLEFAARTGGTCGDEVFAAVPITATTEHFEMVLSSQYADGDSITASRLTSTGTFTNGRGVEDPSNDSNAITINNSYYTEVEYAVQATTNATDGGNYCFRVTNKGSTSNITYPTYAEAAISSSSNQNPDVPTNLGPAGYIDASGWMNDNTPTFNFDITDPDPSEQVKYRIQIDDTSGFGSPVLDYQPSSYGAEGTYNYTVGQAGNYAVGSQGMTLSDSASGGGYYWRVKAIDDDLAESSYEEAGTDGTIDFRVDATAPTGGTIKDGTGADQDWNNGDLDNISANWTGTAPDASTSGLQKYEYALRRQSDSYYWNPGGGGNWQFGEYWTDNGTSTSVTVSSVKLETSKIYYFSVKTYDNAGNTSSPVSSDGQRVTPELSFSMDSNQVNFADLNNANNWTDTKQTAFTTSTNALGGYTIKGYVTDYLRSLAYPSQTITDFWGTWATTQLWDNTCTGGGSNYCGFGYTSNDTLVQGSNRFLNGTKYAAYIQSAPGDVLADHTAAVIGSKITNEQFIITHKVSVNGNQTASRYQTTLVVVVTANY